MNPLRLAVMLVFVLLFAVAPLGAQDDAPLPDATPVVTVDGQPVNDVIIPDELPLPPLDIDIVMPPAVEPDGPQELPESVQLAIVVGIAGFAIVALIVYANHRKLTPQQAFQGLPGLITQYGFPAVWNFLYDRARTTVDPADNIALKEAARFAGYRVTELPGGGVMLERDPAHVPPPVTPTPPGPINFSNLNGTP